MNRCVTGLLVAVVLAIPGITTAQQSPELKRLDALVGTWRVEVELKPTPLTQAIKAQGTQECEWFAGRHVVCRTEAKSAALTYSQMQTISYVPTRKEYAAYSVDSLGAALLASGQISGDTWTFTTNQPPLNLRLTLKMAPGAFTAVAEYSGLDGKYLPLSEIRGTRIK